ncbi:hypothetical protein MsAg5_10120 [Methanosarcinaceae archaeon Ag5]|uniref:Type II secretion system protein GspF domain-containing protein n=1 Tax=Methanolapillus africanus TaxID=3028297 RepID=A0AAE4MK73_9EURY|nr:hypothetical protein [Methanosarcinaceae archaeon Ag5]
MIFTESFSFAVQKTAVRFFGKASDKLIPVFLAAGGGDSSGNKNVWKLFEKKITAARLFIPASVCMSIVLFISAILSIGCVFWEFLLLMAFYFQGDGFEEPLFLLSVPFFIFAGVELLILISAVLLPILIAADKKHKIEQELPFAVNYMSAMAAAGVMPASVFETFAESNIKSVYGAVAAEFLILESRMDFFGEDLPSALLYVSQTTSSPLLSDFLTGSKNTIVSGSDFQSFIFSKKQEYESLFRRQKDQFFQTLDLTSEMYMTVFLAAPVFFIVLLFTIAPLSGPKTDEMEMLVYQAVPFLGLFFLLFADIIDQKYG